MRVFAGTSGYSYKEWKGKFYPEKLPARKMLEFYAGSLPAVEINNTFYRMPNKDMLENWKQQVPADFRFAIKASRRISHKKRLKDAQEETEYLLDALTVLGNRLGIILFQMPPYFRKDGETLDSFLDTLPENIPCAFEFRHESWFDDDIFAVLRAHNKTLCIADETNARFSEPVCTSDIGYLRLRRVEYSPQELTIWARALIENDWKQCYVFFKHKDEAGGPELASQFLNISKEMS